MDCYPNRRNGFTLIELLAVVVLIGLLIAIAVPAIAGAKRSAQEHTSLVNARSCASVLEAWTQNNDGRVPSGELGGTLQAGGRPVCRVILSQNNLVEFDWFGHANFWPTVLLARGEPLNQALLSPTHDWSTSTETDYFVSNAFFADPAYWTTIQAQTIEKLRGQRLSDTSFPSEKVIVSESLPSIAVRHSGEADTRTVRPVVFVDVHAESRNLDEAQPAVVNHWLGTRAVPLLNTLNGVRGRDY